MSPSRPGRPRIATTDNVRRVVRDLINEGTNAVSVTEFVTQFSTRLHCSRRTAFRALAVARPAGLPWGSDTNGRCDSDT
jgi:hypothetical protein